MHDATKKSARDSADATDFAGKDDVTSDVYNVMNDASFLIFKHGFIHMLPRPFERLI